MEDFVANTITTSMLLAFTCTRALNAMASRSTAVPWYLQVYFSFRIPSNQHFLLPLCCKTTCNVSINFTVMLSYNLLQQKLMHLIFMVDMNHKNTLNRKQFSTVYGMTNRPQPSQPHHHSHHQPTHKCGACTGSP